MTDPSTHEFHAVAFVESLALREIAAEIAGEPRPAATSGRPLYDLRRGLGDGEAFYFSFGAVVFRDVAASDREAEVARLRLKRHLQIAANESVRVRVLPAATLGVADGYLTVDTLTPGRCLIIALTIAQSAAVEYYERIVDEMFGKTAEWVDGLEKRGTVKMSVRPLHRFIGHAVATRSEVINVLHLLDKPDETWDDPSMAAIYDDLRDEFDLGDRHDALEHKLKNVQESLELILDVARDRRLFLLEASVVALIMLEIVLSLVRAH
ncbi:MAG: RMD1 family protein [Vicinamibacteria bacterium]